MGSVALLESLGTIIYGGRLLKQLTNIKPIAERGGGAMQRSPSAGFEGDFPSSDNPSFDPNIASASSSKHTSKRHSLMKQLSSPMSSRTSIQLSSDDSEDKRRVRLALKRAKPLTRLVVTSAALLLTATALSAAASFTTVLNSPDTYIVIFALLAACEITIYGLVIQVMSPIWQERRRRFARAESDTQLAPLSEERPGGASFDGNPKTCVACIRKWWICC